MSDFTKRLLTKLHDEGSPLLDLHPELAGRQHVFRGGDAGKEIPAPFTYQKKAGAYSNRHWVHRAIDIWSNNISPLDVRVVDKKDLAEVNHPLNDVLDMPNQEMDKTQFWSEWAIEMGFAGEFGIQMTFRTGDIDMASGAPSSTAVPIEMWPRQGESLTIKTGPSGRRFRKVILYILNDGEEPSDVPIPSDELIFYKFYNPLDVFRGLSRLTALRLSVDIDFKAQLWSEQFFNNSARPDYALITPEGITKTEKKEILQDLWNRFRGVKRSHLPMILEKGITDIKTLSFPPKDLAWIEQRKISRDEIGAIFGVPDEMMGYGRNTYENFDTADRVLWTNTILPLINFRDNMLTWYFKKVRPVLEKNQLIRTDVSTITQLREDNSDIIKQWVDLVGKGVPPRTAAQTLVFPLLEYNGDSVGYASEFVQPISSAKGFELQSTTKAVKNEDESTFPEFGSDEHKATVEARQNLLFPLQQKMAKELKKYFQRQQTELNARLRSRQNLEFGRGKYVGKQGDDLPNIDIIFPLQDEVDKFKEQFGPIIRDSYMLVADGWWDELGLDGQFEVTQAVENSISFITDFQAREVNRTTFSELARIFTEAEEEGQGIPAIQENLSAFWGGRKSVFETERIARTTMVAADNAGSQASWDQSGVVKTKIWISALLPGRTRPHHAEAHGQEVLLNQDFIVGGEPLSYPGDPDGSAGNIINCLCVTIPGKIEV